MRRRGIAVLCMAAVLLLANGCGAGAPAAEEKAVQTAAAGTEAETEKTAQESGAAEEEKEKEKEKEEGAGTAEKEISQEKKDGGEAAKEDASADADGELSPEQGFDFDAWYADLYRSCDEAYKNQRMPDVEFLPYVPYPDMPPEKPYESVTAENLQGRWVNCYKEGGVEFEEVLTVNGDLARIETFQDGVKKGVWNGEGYFSIEDRSARHVCPAFRINDDEGNLCTIYIRWVKEGSFYDGGFLREWKREETEDLSEQYLFDTVTMENLQGLWYTDYVENDSFYQVMLKVDGDKSFIFETKDGEPTDYWNGEGEASLVTAEFRSFIHWPELLINKEDGKNLCGIYISRVDEYAFYDPGLHNWYMRVTEEGLREMGLYPEDWNVTWLEDGGAKVVNTYTVTTRPTVPILPDEEDTVRYVWNVTVEGEDGVKGEFRTEVYEDSIYFPDAANVVWEEDVNMDGFMDLVVFRGAVGARGTTYYDCYLREGKGFVRLDGYPEIPDPYADPQTGRIIGTARDAANAYAEEIYEIRGHAVELVEDHYYVWDESAGDYVEKQP